MTSSRRMRLIVACGTPLVVAAVIGLVIGFFHIYFNSSGGTGSIDEAVRLRAILEPIATPEDGAGCHPEYAAKRFPNGEWVICIGRDSHAAWSRYVGGGGTLVIKDSRGRVRCFLGHVCGGGAGGLYTHPDAMSLDEFDRLLGMKSSLQEVPWPDAS